MSTVILTPTHIASDHNFIRNTQPFHCKTDIHHPKLYVDPHKGFILGIAGDVIPEHISEPEVRAAIYAIMIEVKAWDTIKSLQYDLFHLVSQKEIIKPFTDVMDNRGQAIIVSKHDRIMVYRSSEKDHWKAKRCGDYVGIGSGGNYAMGMVQSGMPLKDIWKPLHDLDPPTSVEHTILPLSLLKPVKELK